MNSGHVAAHHRLQVEQAIRQIRFTKKHRVSRRVPESHPIGFYFYRVHGQVVIPVQGYAAPEDVLCAATDAMRTFNTTRVDIVGRFLK